MFEWRYMREKREGYSLVELIATLGLLSVAIPAIGNLLFVTSHSYAHRALEVQAQYLAGSLLSEVSQKRFFESDTSPGNSPEMGEVAGFSRLLFDDIDDYNQFRDVWDSLSPPRDASGNVLTGYEEFSQYVEVYNVPDVGSLPLSRNLVSVADGTSQFKIATIVIGWENDRRSFRVSRMFVNW